MKKVFVTGGTGFIGAHVVRQLVERGDDVTVLVRPSSNLILIKNLPVTKAYGDLTDLNSLLPGIDGAEELYHIAADYRLWARNPREIYINNVCGTRNILSAALRLEVPKVVYTSSVGCLGLCKNGSGDESTLVFRNQLIGHYKKSKYDAEQVALEYADKGLNMVIVNPSTPVGPGDVKPTPTGKIILDYLNGKMRGYVNTGLNLIAVEDVARGHLLAAQKGTPGEKYILGCRNMTLKQILCALAEITGRKAPRIRIPYWLALAAAGADSARSKILNVEPFIPIEGVLMARRKMFFSAAKALRELNLPQSPVEEALERSVKWFRDNGYTTELMRQPL